MDVDKLLVVAHPDDEVLWGGLNLLLQPGWFVVCSTHLNDPVRSLEFYKTMSYANVTRYVMYDVKDEYTEEAAVSRRLFQDTPFENGLKELAKHPWKLVLTHNNMGEYGHEHHKTVHSLVMKYFPSAVSFKVGERLKPTTTEHKRDLLQFYKATQNICKKLYEKDSSRLKISEREHFFNETIYVTPTRKISNIIHQIWFGKPLDRTTIRYNLMNRVKEVANRNGFDYKVWTNDDLKEETLPLTWRYIQRATETGEELGQSRFAQVADLARYELLHRFGGVYLDSLFELGDEFCKYIKDRSDQFELIVANEDPCKLKCVGSGGKKYMSNGFFACVPGCVILKRLLQKSSLDSIDFESVYINRTTGPYYFRKGMIARDKIHVIDTPKIYPFMVNDSEYRPGAPNQCITEGDKLLHDCLHKKYPKSLTIYHSGFGGSWSW
jgi:hypothetical protein